MLLALLLSFSYFLVVRGFLVFWLSHFLTLRSFVLFCCFVSLFFMHFFFSASAVDVSCLCVCASDWFFSLAAGCFSFFLLLCAFFSFFFLETCRGLLEHVFFILQDSFTVDGE